MSVKIEIELYPEHGAIDVQLADAMLALGFERKQPTLRQIAEAAHDAGFEVDVALNAKAAAEADATPKRERGQPSPGKSRRTKAEIAEDEAADAADAEARGGISTDPENRTDPENPEDSEADAEQDAADEAAEVAAERQPDAPLSIDDVKALATEYQARYGMAAVQEDGKLIFKEALGNPPEGNDFWRFSLVPTDQPTLKKLTATWQRAIDENPLKRERV